MSIRLSVCRHIVNRFPCIVMSGITKTNILQFNTTSNSKILPNADFAKYVGPTVKSDRNLIGPIKPTFFSDQMSAIVQDRISVFTDVLYRFPRFSFVAWFPVKVNILIHRLNYSEAAVLWKKRTVDTS